MGCGDGPASFNAEMSRRGHRAVSCDPLYNLASWQIEGRIAATYDDMMRFLEERSLTAKDWAKTAEHDEYNSSSMFVMMRHLALHDFFHAYRIEELLLRKDWPQLLPQ